jgi:hypothetical protein
MGSMAAEESAPGVCNEVFGCRIEDVEPRGIEGFAPSTTDPKLGRHSCQQILVHPATPSPQLPSERLTVSAIRAAFGSAMSSRISAAARGRRDPHRRAVEIVEASSATIETTTEEPLLQNVLDDLNSNALASV